MNANFEDIRSGQTIAFDCYNKRFIMYVNEVNHIRIGGLLVGDKYYNGEDFFNRKNIDPNTIEIVAGQDELCMYVGDFVNLDHVQLSYLNPGQILAVFLLLFPQTKPTKIRFNSEYNVVIINCKMSTINFKPQGRHT